MAKVRIKNLKSVFNAAEKAIKEGLTDDAFYNDQSRYVAERIKTETRRGNDISGEGLEKTKQKKLTNDYIEFREKLKMQGGAGLDWNGKVIEVDLEFFRPAKSNLTLTGQLLNSVTGKYVKSKKEIVVGVEGQRNDGLSNQDVANDLADRGRRFLGIDRIGVRVIRQKLVDIIRRSLLKRGF